jgi:hypothetical protein
MDIRKYLYNSHKTRQDASTTTHSSAEYVSSENTVEQHIDTIDEKKEQSATQTVIRATNKPSFIELSQKKRKEYVIELFNKIMDNNNGKVFLDKSHTYYNEIIDFLKFHPKGDRKLKLNDLRKVCVDNSIGHWRVFLVYQNNIDSISWNKCITSREEPYTQRLGIALRYAIQNQIDDFKMINNISTCELCGTRDRVIHIDHIIPFSILRDVFNEGRDDIPIEFTKCDNMCGYTGFGFKDDDKLYEDDWIYFHKKYAMLRPLCDECNLQRKNSISDDDVLLINNTLDRLKEPRYDSITINKIRKHIKLLSSQSFTPMSSNISNSYISNSHNIEGIPNSSELNINSTRCPCNDGKILQFKSGFHIKQHLLSKIHKDWESKQVSD